MPTAAPTIIKVIKKHIHRIRRAANACFIASRSRSTLVDRWRQVKHETRHAPFSSIVFDLDSFALSKGDLFVLL